MRDERSHISLGWFVLLALFFHLMASLMMVVPPETAAQLAERKNAEKNKNKEIEIIDPKDLEERSVVESSRLKEQDPALDSIKPRFYSDEKNRTKEETKSPLKGKFREGTILSQKGGGGEKGSELPLGDDGDEAGSDGGQKSPNLKDLMLFSRTPNDLPGDIKEGTETVLNSDKILYASFINRVAEEVYDPWVTNLQTAITETQFRKQKLETNLYVTKVLVTMDKEGEIQGIKLVKSSGVDSIDDAPKKAFWNLEVFRNPPSQLVQSDGFIRLTYEFHLEYNSSGFKIIPDRL